MEKIITKIYIKSWVRGCSQKKIFFFSSLESSMQDEAKAEM